jgi:hypothetical protein
VRTGLREWWNGASALERALSVGLLAVLFGVVGAAARRVRLRAWWNDARQLERSAALAGLVVGLLLAAVGAAAAIAAVSGIPQQLALAVLSAGVLAVAVVAALTMRAGRAAALAEHASWLLTSKLMPVDKVDPYLIGVDREQRVEDLTWRYVSRDREEDLRLALDAALASRRVTSMVVLRGLPKAGKSRTLFEVLRHHPELQHATLVAPTDAAALSKLLTPGILNHRGSTPLVLWLDDLELFVGLDRGMRPEVFPHLAGWPRQVIVVATSGGKGASKLSRDGRARLTVPMQRLLGEPYVVIIPLDSQPTVDELIFVTETDYPPEAVEEIATHGIGEYMVAATELSRKFDDETHTAGDLRSPEGAAVVWATIDWQRAGLLRPIPEHVLEGIWPSYVSGVAPTSERFRAGIEWALRAPYRSIGLVSRKPAGYEAYSYIVRYAEGKRPLALDSWECFFQEASAEEALSMGVAAYERVAGFDDGWMRAAVRAMIKAEASMDRNDLVGTAASNLGVMLKQLGDVEGAEAAFRRGDERGSGAAAFNLGVLLRQRDDLEGTEAAFRRSDERGSGDAASNLGLLLKGRGDLEGAEAAFRRGDGRGSGSAAFNLGVLLEERRDPEGAEAAFRRADERGVAVTFRDGDECGTPVAVYDLGGQLEQRSDVDGGR